MASGGWNSGQQREAMLRRTAIVLSSLPASVASQLLGSIDPETTKAVRRTMTSLSDVDPLERQRALQAFKVSVKQQPPLSPRAGQTARAAEDRGINEGIGPRGEGASRVVSSSLPNSPSPQPETSPLEFLGDVADDDLVHLLSAEHPQAIALVLASIAPAHAARILPRLDQDIRRDALSRVGRLGEIPQAAAADVAEHFKACLARQAHVEKKASGQRVLDAILAAMPAARPAGPSSSPPTSERSIPDPAKTETLLGSQQPRPSADKDVFPSAEIAAIDLTHKLRVAQQTWPDAYGPLSRPADAPVAVATSHPPAERLSAGASVADPVVDEPTRAEQAGGDQQVLNVVRPPTDPENDPERSPQGLDSTDGIHQHLLSLAPEQLCQALGRVETRDAMLALCGLPNQVAESVLAVLPKAHAKKVRVRMNSLGSLHLREIDDAKERVAQASLDTSGQGLTPVPVAA